MTHNEVIHFLKKRLKEPLPGMDAQFEMAHINREKINPELINTDDYRRSAVLAVLYPKADSSGTTLLLIRRAIDGKAHSGQIALPGGKEDPEDMSLENTALREFFEETGSDKTPEIIGQLSTICIPISKFVVHPFIGLLEQKPNFNPNENEVHELIEWDLEKLVYHGPIQSTTIQVTTDVKFNAPYFDVEGKILWGATAMMLNEFRKLF